MIFTPETVLNIGLGIEQKGIEVYERMKGSIGNGTTDYLIGQEKEHIEKFKELFSSDSQLFEEPARDVGHLDEDYLGAAYVETSVFGNLDISSVNADNLLDTAISMEKESIMFYSDLMAYVPEKYPVQRALLNDLRTEERKHLVRVTQMKKDREETT